MALQNPRWLASVWRGYVIAGGPAGARWAKILVCGADGTG
ncbi:hypothetical protein ABIE67_008119 [Streptomyces sp. V4I8]